MLLKDWLKKNNLPAYKFAKQIGIASETIYRSLRGKRRLSARNALKIERATGGAVTRTELLWPEDYVDTDENGEEQYRMTPRV